ncbi:MAG TPA: DUF503 domain-containing protein [Polyangia bacterium]|nr:DUF503 domain-containing protein [Polyangia bacterium]
MVVGIARVTLFVAGSLSLKDKRTVVRRVKDLVLQKFDVAIAEVGDQDVYQRAVLGLAVVGNDARHVSSVLDAALDIVRAKAEVLDVEREIQTFSDGDPLKAGEPPYKHWEPK